MIHWPHIHPDTRINSCMPHVPLPDPGTHDLCGVSVVCVLVSTLYTQSSNQLGYVYASGLHDL